MLFEWVLEHFHCMLEVLEHPRGHGFRWVSRRWVVERTLAWISRCRRLSQDDEKIPPASETFIYLAMIPLMLKRLAGTSKNQPLLQTPNGIMGIIALYYCKSTNF